MRNPKFAIPFLMALLAMLSACDSDNASDDEDLGDAGDTDTGDTDTGDTDSDDDDDDDNNDNDDNDVDLPDGGPIDDLGITDLDYDGTPIDDPMDGLPTLENVDPVYTPALAGQALPDEATQILELEKVVAYTGYGSEDALAAELRGNGIARQLSVSSQDLMAEALMGPSASYLQPGVFLSSDALFNTFHNFFDNMLLGVELRTLRPRVLAMLHAIKVEAAKRYNSLEAGKTKDAALDVVAYLQVAESLMDPNAEMIAEVKSNIEDEFKLIMPHSGSAASPVLDRPEYSEVDCVDCDPCKGINEGGCVNLVGETAVPCKERYCEDYSQYVPRGHYTYNEELEQYFRSVMWLGRMTFLNRSDQSTRGVAILVDSVKSAVVDLAGESTDALSIWRQFFRVVGTFVGSMDDLNIAEIDGAITAALGDSFSLSMLDDDANVTSIQAEVEKLRDPQILSGYLSALADMGKETKGLRLLGQVFLPDSYGFGQVIFNNVGPSDNYVDDPESMTDMQIYNFCSGEWDEWNWDACRGMPSGLDVASFLGSSKAAALAHERWDQYAFYADQLDAMIAEFDSYGLDRWGISLSWTWLYALKGLFKDVDPGMPPFMRTDAWEYKNLETGLTSWAEMRHDTILYAKPSYTPGGDCDTDSDTDVDYDFDYVEPQPEAYSRLGAAAGRLRDLAADESLFLGDAACLAEYLDGLVALFDRAQEISIKEVEGQELDDADVSWIRYSGGKIHYLENSLLESLGLFDEEEEPDPDRLKTTIIADVHTFGDKKVVLEVGSGYLDYVVVLHQLPTGQWGVAVGPAFNYHEFEQDMSDRLTDEQWRETLQSNPDFGSPDWLLQ